MYQRHLLEINDTGTAAVTSAPVVGEIRQMAWNPTSDTGATVEVTLMPRAADTGDGIQLYNEADVAQGQFVVAPVIAEVDALGLDTGVDSYAAPVAAGDAIRLKTTAKGTLAVNGKLYVWTRR